MRRGQRILRTVADPLFRTSRVPLMRFYGTCRHRPTGSSLAGDQARLLRETLVRKARRPPPGFLGPWRGRFRASSCCRAKMMQWTSGHSQTAWRTRQNDPVWTAPHWQGFFERLCNAGWCGHVSDLFARHIPPLAIMPSAYQVPTISSHSRCWVEMGSPDPAVSTGLLHQLPFALPNLVSATAAALCL
jgi:hypothetical protein